jgi:hypothetical protein
MSVDLTRKASQIKRGKDKQAQIMPFTPPVRNVSIHEINLVLLRKKKCLCKQITGCTITPNGKFIFADYGPKALHIINEDWTSATWTSNYSYILEFP